MNSNSKRAADDAQNPRLDKKSIIKLYANVIIEQNRDLSQADKIISDVKKAILQYIVISEEGAGLIAESAYETALYSKRDLVRDEIRKLETEDEQKSIEVYKATSNDVGKFARLIPRSTVNPNVTAEILNGNFKSAAKGFAHKLARAVSLRSASAFDLKTKKGNTEDDKKAKKEMADHISENQFENAYNTGYKVELLQRIKEISEHLTDLQLVEPKLKLRIEALKSQLKKIGSEAQETQSAVGKFESMVRIMAYEKDQATGHVVDRVVGKMYEGYRKFTWADKMDPFYADAFYQQAKIENDLVRFEEVLKEVIGIDLNSSPVEPNKNASSDYSSSTTLREFSARQSHIQRRLDVLDGLLSSAKTTINGEVAENRNNLKAAEKYIDSHKDTIGKINSIAKKWGKVETPNLEKLFWHEFGSQVDTIRDWQSKLPRIGRNGPEAYKAKVTSISSEFEKIRVAIEELEAIQNSEISGDVGFTGMKNTGKFKGLMGILERELGIIKSNPFSNSTDKIKKEIEEIRQEIAEREEEKKYFESLIETLHKSPVSEERPVDPSKNGAPPSEPASNTVPPEPKDVPANDNVADTSNPKSQAKDSANENPGDTSNPSVSSSSVPPRGPNSNAAGSNESPRDPNVPPSKPNAGSSNGNNGDGFKQSNDNVGDTSNPSVSSSSVPPRGPNSGASGSNESPRDPNVPPSKPNAGSSNGNNGDGFKQSDDDLQVDVQTDMRTADFVDGSGADSQTSSDNSPSTSAGMKETSPAYSENFKISLPEFKSDYDGFNSRINSVIDSDQYTKNSKGFISYNFVPNKTETKKDDLAPETPRVSETKEILTPHEVVAIGDLHGNMEIFTSSLKSLGLIADYVDAKSVDKWKWTGGNRKLVLLGDILADRNDSSFAIFNGINTLQGQAKATNGKIVVIAGNHEDFAISFLVGKYLAKLPEPGRMETFGESDFQSQIDSVSNSIGFSEQGKGLMEFIRNFSDLTSKAKNDQDAINIVRTSIFTQPKLGEEVLFNMRQSPIGRKMLEQMCNLQLLELDGESLFLHTELTDRILERISVDGEMSKIVESVNGTYQQGLRKLLLDEGKMPENDEFYRLSNSFLCTNNRDFYGIKDDFQDIAEILKAKGVKRIIHGHTDNAGNANSDFFGIELLNIDFGAGKLGEKMDGRSIAYITADGKSRTGNSIKLSPVTEKQEAKVDSLPTTLDSTKVKTEPESEPTTLPDKKIIQNKVETVKNYLADIFSLEPDKAEAQAEELTKLIGQESLDKLNDENLKIVLQYFAMGSMKSVAPLKEGYKMRPVASEIYSILNFYFNWLKQPIEKGRSVESVLNEIQKYDTSADLVQAKWIEKYNAKEESEERGYSRKPETRRSGRDPKHNYDDQAPITFKEKKSTDVEEAVPVTVRTNEVSEIAKLRNLPTDGQFDMSKSPTPNEEILASEDTEKYYEEVSKKLGFLFTSLSKADLTELKGKLENLKVNDVIKFAKIIKSIYQYQREFRFLFSGELGGIRVLSLSGNEKNDGYISQVPVVMKTGNDLANITKVEGKLQKLKDFLDTLAGKNATELRKHIAGKTGSILESMKVLLSIKQ